MLRHVNVGISFGIAMAIRLAIFYYLGRWADRKLGTEPWLTLLGILLAIGMSFHHLITEFIKVDGSGGDDVEEPTKRE
ncbi:MAG: AtpZ/AtpI family protein [Clostridia bacterium]|nr:AtpZ/AtpI family protein [Clostridia bacterium]